MNLLAIFQNINDNAKYMDRFIYYKRRRNEIKLNIVMSALTLLSLIDYSKTFGHFVVSEHKLTQIALLAD